MSIREIVDYKHEISRHRDYYQNYGVDTVEVLVNLIARAWENQALITG